MTNDIDIIEYMNSRWCDKITLEYLEGGRRIYKLYTIKGEVLELDYKPYFVKQSFQKTFSDKK